MPRERITKVTPDSNLVGTECMYCHKTIEAETEVVVCPRCKAVHHVNCWKERRGCARLGCSQIAEAVLPTPEETNAEKRLGDNIYLEKERPKRKWKIALGALAALIVIALLAYRGPDPAAGKEKITVMVQGGYLETEFYEKLAEQFNQAHPDWYLETLVTPYAGYEQKLVVMLGARLAPTIFIAPTDRYAMYAEQGALLAIDAYLANAPEVAERFFPEGIEPLKIGGNVYGIPHPYAQEIFGIYSLADHPDIAWTALVEILDAIERDYPKELRNTARNSQQVFPMQDN